MTVGSKVKQTLSNLKSIESTLRLYSTQIDNKKESNAYLEALKTTETVIKDVEDRLKIIEFQEPQYKGN
jgi:hypothetical protein